MTEERISDDWREAWEERAAIIEEGCKVSRAEAERMAAEQMELTDDEIEFMRGAK